MVSNLLFHQKVYWLRLQTYGGVKPVTSYNISVIQVVYGIIQDTMHATLNMNVPSQKPEFNS